MQNRLGKEKTVGKKYCLFFKSPHSTLFDITPENARGIREGKKKRKSFPMFSI
jgi:hypothetical protein